MDLIQDAQRVFAQNFPPDTCFERAIFFSWYCGIGDCQYCYMSTKGHKKTARRTRESILAEIALCRMLGWELGFISGGHGAYSTVEFESLLEDITRLWGDKVWINVGALKAEELKRYAPYVKGVVASVETVNPTIHGKVCPSKPLGPYENMLTDAAKLGIARAMTLIIGLGETIEDFTLLVAFIKRHGITKIHIYSLNPHKGTLFEHAEPPKPEYQAEWIARTRIAFPRIDIQAGIWLNRVEMVSLLLRAGANSISKFPAIRYFGSTEAREIEKQAEDAGRAFRGTLTRFPVVNTEDLDDATRAALERYLKKMRACAQSSRNAGPR
jgi:biotin synthase-like enzyme